MHLIWCKLEPFQWIYRALLHNFENVMLFFILIWEEIYITSNIQKWQITSYK